MRTFRMALIQAERYGSQIAGLLGANRITEAYRIQDAANNFVRQFVGRERFLLKREIGIDAYTYYN